MKKTIIFLFFLFSVNITYAQNYNLIIGTYTNKGNSEGIYVYDYNALTADTKLKSTTKTVNPSYLAVSPNKKYIYSVNEDGNNSTVSSFRYNSKSGSLTFLNKKSSEGADPCYITIDHNVIIANYSGGSISVLGRNADGSLTDAKQVLKHTGKSIDLNKRQESAHAHQVLLTPDKRYIISNDLGEDQIYIYKIISSHNFTLGLWKTIKTNPGSGPRHMIFSPNGKFAYLAHEFNGSITAFRYNDGNLSKLQEVSTTTKDFKGKIDGADIHVSPDGKFLYETNRGDANTISLFAIAQDGTLTFIETINTLGKGPRNFSMDPNGNFLLVAHQYTNEVVIFKRNKTTGKLTDSGKRINVGVPVCLVFDK